ncbi:MAG: hypothetical protein WCB12_15820 [Bryobacteraceae bacterium]
MTTNTTARRITWLTAFILSATGARLGAQMNPTLAQREIFRNVDKLESKMTLDQEEYLPGENARITVTLRNPTIVPLQIPEPFYRQTGGCYMIKKGIVGPDLYGDEQWAGGASTQHIFWSVPTIILAPGQEVTQTVSTRDGTAWGGQFYIPDQPGEWRMKYGYDQRMHADFKIVRATKVWAVSVVHLPPAKEKDEIGRSTIKVPIVPFMVIETLPGEYWLFRGAAHNREISPWPFQEYTLRVLFNQIRFFERVQRVDEPVTSLQAALRDDGTVDVAAKTAKGQMLRFNVPSVPSKNPPPAQ